jgi:hypothetical protein
LPSGGQFSVAVDTAERNALQCRKRTLGGTSDARPRWHWSGHRYADCVAIQTPDQRIRVFVSSTMQELAPERRAVREPPPNAGHV